MVRLRRPSAIGLGRIAGIATYASALILGLLLGLPAPIAAVGALGPGVFSYLLVTPHDRLARLAKQSYSTVPFLLTLAGGAIFFWLGDHTDLDPGAGFFEVTSQVLPVLILTTIVDVRRADQIATAAVIPTMMVLMLGEGVALYGIMRPGLELYALVCGSLTCGFSALVLSVFSENTKQSSRSNALQERSSEESMPRG